MSPVARTHWVTFGCNGTLVESTGTRNAVEAFRQTDSVHLFEDVEAMLAELRSQGFRLAVLTNCHDRVFEAIHRRFAKPFDLFVTAERVRGYKPCRWHFRAFELLTRVARHDWVHVGCSVYHDVAPAEAFGVKGVWLDRHPSTRGARSPLDDARGDPELVEGSGPARTGDHPSAVSAHVRSAREAVEAVVALAITREGRQPLGAA